jgi:hypothetical protein
MPQAASSAPVNVAEGLRAARLVPSAADKQPPGDDLLTFDPHQANGAAATSASSTAKQGVKQCAEGRGSITDCGENLLNSGKAAQWSPELATGFSKSSRLKEERGAEHVAPVAVCGASTASESISGAAASPDRSAGFVDLQSTVMQGKTASPMSGAGTGGGSQVSASAKQDGGFTAALLSATSSSTESTQGGEDHALERLRWPGMKQAETALRGVKQPVAAKQPTTAKQKGGELPMAKDTPDMRAQFVKQLLSSAFDMDRQW